MPNKVPICTEREQSIAVLLVSGEPKYSFDFMMIRMPTKSEAEGETSGAKEDRAMRESRTETMSINALRFGFAGKKILRGPAALLPAFMMPTHCRRLIGVDRSCIGWLDISSNL